MGGKCSVCGDRATKFRYSLYSTTSCFSCRAFFRRSLVGNKFETFTCRSVTESKSCQVTATNRKKCQACRFAKCRQMGMTHTTLETQPGAGAQIKTTGYKNNSSPYLSVKSPSVSLTPVVEEPTGFTNDNIYDYDVNINQPLQGEEQVEYYYSTETKEVTGETFFSYKVLPPSDSYPSSMTNMTNMTNNSYVLPVETFPVDNFTIYDDFMQEAAYQENSTKGREFQRYQGDYSANYSLEQTEEYPTGQDSKNNITDYELPLVFEPLDSAADMIVPPIRLLYSDETTHDLSLQLQLADLQSALTWPEMVALLEDVMILPANPEDIVEQVATLILMEEQLTETVFNCIKTVIWNKLSKFVQSVPELYQLSKAELNCLWENNKDVMLVMVLAEILNSKYTSLQEQINAVKLIKFSDGANSSTFSLAPAVTVNLFRNVFYSLWQETVRQRLSRSVELVSRIPSDRTVTSYLTLLLFLSLDKTELYSEKEPFIQRVKSLEYKTEVSLKLYLESSDPAGYQETWDRTKYKLDTIKNINKI